MNKILMLHWARRIIAISWPDQAQARITGQGKSSQGARAHPTL